MKISVVFTALTTLVASQVYDGLPECSAKCLADSAAKFGCRMDDIVCQCSNSNLINEDAAICLTKNCSTNDRNTFHTEASRHCLHNGYSLDHIPKPMKRMEQSYEPVVCWDGAYSPCPSDLSDRVVGIDPPMPSVISSTTGYQAPSLIVETTIPCKTVTLTVTSIVGRTSKVRTSTLYRTSIVIVTTKIVSPPYPTGTEASTVYRTSTVTKSSLPTPPVYPPGTGAPTAIPSHIVSTGSYKPVPAPVYTAGVEAVCVPVAVAGMVGLAAMVL